MNEFKINVENNNIGHQPPENCNIILVELQLIYGDNNQECNPRVLILTAREGINCETSMHRIPSNISYDHFINIIDIKRNYSKKLRVAFATQWINDSDITEPKNITWLKKANNVLIYDNNNNIQKGTNILLYIYLFVYSEKLLFFVSKQIIYGVQYVTVELK